MNWIAHIPKKISMFLQLFLNVFSWSSILKWKLLAAEKSCGIKSCRNALSAAIPLNWTKISAHVCWLSRVAVWINGTVCNHFLPSETFKIAKFLLYSDRKLLIKNINPAFADYQYFCPMIQILLHIQLSKATGFIFLSIPFLWLSLERYLFPVLNYSRVQWLVRLFYNTSR